MEAALSLLSIEIAKYASLRKRLSFTVGSSFDQGSNIQRRKEERERERERERESE